MLKTLTGVFVLIAALAGCAPMQTADPQSVRIEGTPGMSVIYLMRSNPDWSYIPTQVYIDYDADFIGDELDVRLTAVTAPAAPR